MAMTTEIRAALKTHTSEQIKNDMELFKNNEKNREEGYSFRMNAFLNRIFLSMCTGQHPEMDNAQNKRGTTSPVTVKLNKQIRGLFEKAGVNGYGNPVHSDYVSEAKYYTYFIDEYAKFNQEEREKIFYKDMMADTEDCISGHRLVSVTWWKNRHENCSRLVIPYRIVFAEEVNQHYFICFYLVQDGNTYKYDNTLTIPLHRILSFEKSGIIFRNIDEAVVFDNPHFHSFDELKDYTADRIKEGEAIFLSASRETVEVELTDDGLTYLYSRSVLRPAKIERLPYPNHHRIRFKATKLHTFMYFFKFGKDAVIISPKSFRNFFISNYKDAVQKYESLDN